MTCHAKRQGDEMKCGLCLRSWKHDDPRPPRCPENGKDKDKNNRNNSVKTRRFRSIIGRRTFDPLRYNADGPKIY